MNAGFVTLVIGLGAGAIALWIDARFPQLTPQAIAKAVFHVAAAVAVGYATSPAFQALTEYEDPRLILVAVFAVAFPAIVYFFLAGVWMIKLAQQTLRGQVR